MSWAADTCWPQSWSPGFLWTRPRTSRRSWRTRWRILFGYPRRSLLVQCGGIFWQFLFVSVSDLSEHPAAVPQGAVWVQVHADWPQLVQLLLRSPNTQGESVLYVGRMLPLLWQPRPWFIMLTLFAGSRLCRWHCWTLEPQEDSIRVSQTST